MQLIDRVQQKCKEQGTNFRKIEQDLGFGNGTLRKWDTQKPSYDKVLLVAKKLNVSLDWLITGKESEDLTPEEQRLIETYRQCNSIGQSLIQEQADAIRQKLPAEKDHLQDQPAGVSSSAIG